jgi:glycosyltransferase involved in cell wall biosynthesis
MRQVGLKEIIVVDDGSTEACYQRLLAFAQEIPILSVIKTEKNSGAGAARNFGTKKATGEFICFLDADDELLSGYLETAIRLIDENPQFSSIKVGMQFVDFDYEPVILPGDPRYMSLLVSSSCNIFLRKSAFEKIGGFPEDERFRGPFGGEDAAFSRAVEDYLSPIGYLPEAFYRVHDRPDSHLQKFLGNTRVKTTNEFEFIRVFPEQMADGALASAIDDYLTSISKRISPLAEQ